MDQVHGIALLERGDSGVLSDMRELLKENTLRCVRDLTLPSAGSYPDVPALRIRVDGMLEIPRHRALRQKTHYDSDATGGRIVGELLHEGRFHLVSRGGALADVRTVVARGHVLRMCRR